MVADKGIHGWVGEGGGGGCGRSLGLHWWDGESNAWARKQRVPKYQRLTNIPSDSLVAALSEVRGTQTCGLVGMPSGDRGLEGSKTLALVTGGR